MRTIRQWHGQGLCGYLVERHGLQHRSKCLACQQSSRVDGHIDEPKVLCTLLEHALEYRQQIEADAGLAREALRSLAHPIKTKFDSDNSQTPNTNPTNINPTNRPQYQRTNINRTPTLE